MTTPRRPNPDPLYDLEAYTRELNMDEAMRVPPGYISPSDPIGNRGLNRVPGRYLDVLEIVMRRHPGYRAEIFPVYYGLELRIHGFNRSISLRLTGMSSPAEIEYAAEESVRQLQHERKREEGIEAISPTPLYMLNKDKIVVGTLHVETWRKFMSDEKNYVVGLVTQHGVTVFTRFIGALPPRCSLELLLFETVVTGGVYDRVCWKYATWQEADEGHRAAVARVFAGPKTTKRLRSILIEREEP